MRIVSVLEDQKIEKRIAITPEIAKKYLALGFEVALPENYADHLGIKDNEYTELGVNISRDEQKIISSADFCTRPLVRSTIKSTAFLPYVLTSNSGYIY